MSEHQRESLRGGAETEGHYGDDVTPTEADRIAADIETHHRDEPAGPGWGDEWDHRVHSTTRPQPKDPRADQGVPYGYSTGPRGWQS